MINIYLRAPFGNWPVGFYDSKAAAAIMQQVNWVHAIHREVDREIFPKLWEDGS